MDCGVAALYEGKRGMCSPCTKIRPEHIENYVVLYIMVCLERFQKKWKGDLIIITPQKGTPRPLCPACGGELFVRGTCIRKAINSEGNTEFYRLRVLQCRGCHKTHRELPNFLVPYKRYDREAIIKILSNNNGEVQCENSTIFRIRKWWEWFLPYARRILESQNDKFDSIEYANEEMPEFRKLIRAVMNKEKWIHNRSAFNCVY